jgi:hypothetical protein
MPLPSEIDRHARDANRGFARAHHIARGLMRTRRAIRGVMPHSDAEFVQLPTITAGGFYWIAVDGSRVLRGHSFIDAAELQPGFADRMERAGAA